MELGFNGVFFVCLFVFFFLVGQAWDVQLYFRASLVCNFTDLVNG